MNHDHALQRPVWSLPARDAAIPLEWVRDAARLS